MESNRPQLHTIAAALAVLLMIVPGLAAQEEPQPRPAIEVIQVYLTQDCGTGDPDPDLWLTRVIALGQEAVPMLVEAVRQGPPSSLREELEADAARDFERLSALVREGGLDAVEEEEVVQMAEELDRATYVSMRLQSFERPYRERALNALGAIDAPEARAALEKIAADRSLDEELIQRAKEALEAVDR